MLSEFKDDNIVRYYNSWIVENFSISSVLENDNSYNSLYSASISETSYKNTSALFIQMELCECSLADELMAKHLDSKKRMKIFKDIISGLYYIHKKDIIHHDLKPQNILLSNDKYKIADFGLSFPSDEQDKVHDAGTVLYKAPEIKHEFNSDMYSLGIILFEMCISDKYKNTIKTINHIKELEVSDNFPKNFEDNYPIEYFFIKRLIYKDPQSRLSSEVLYQAFTNGFFYDKGKKELVLFVNWNDTMRKNYYLTRAEVIFIGYNVDRIETSSFNNFEGLKEIFIPNSVTSINDNAFSNCSKLANIAIPNTVTSIGESAFHSYITKHFDSFLISHYYSLHTHF